MTQPTPSPMSPPTTAPKLLLGTIATLARTLLGAYGMNTTLLMVVWALVGESWAWVGFFNSFAHWLWLGALLCLPLAILLAGRKWSWQWATVFMLLPPALAFLVVYAPRFVPTIPLPPPPDSVLLRLYTHNIAPRTSHFDGIDALIATSNADLIALQEISHQTADHLALRWRDDYPYMALQPGDPTPHSGQAFLSRYPILEATYWQFDWLPNRLGHQRIVLDVDGHEIVVYNLHPTHPAMTSAIYDATDRAREVSALLGIIRQEERPIILMGDFNFHDTSADYDRFNALFTDVYRQVGWGFGLTFPTPSDAPSRQTASINQWVRPLLRLDYIFTSAIFSPLHARVLPTSGGSDHLPVLAEIAFNPPP